MVIGNEEEGDVKNDCQISGLLKQVDRGAISEKEHNTAVLASRELKGVNEFNLENITVKTLRHLSEASLVP